MNVNCPTCKKSVEWRAENECRPFCSKRCQLIDLGEWASEGYKVAQVTVTPKDKTFTEQDLSPEQIEEIEVMLAEQGDDVDAMLSRINLS